MASSQHLPLDPRLSAAQFDDDVSPHALQPSPNGFIPGAGYRNDAFKTGAIANALRPYDHFPSPQSQTPIHARGSVGHLLQHSDASQDGDVSGHSANGQASRSPEFDGDGAAGDDAKRQRACDACRGLKVRCDQDPADPDVPCRRCAKAGRACVITQPSRKRRKKSDSRVAELEKKLDALTAALHQQQQQQQAGGKAALTPGTLGFDSPSTLQAPYSASSQAAAPITAPHVSATATRGIKRKLDGGDEEPTETPSLDVADISVRIPTTNAGHNARADNAPLSSAPTLRAQRSMAYTNLDEFTKQINSLISPALASTIFDRYVTELAPQLPAVVFPAGMTAERLFKEKPILYVCILSASASETLSQDVARSINREAIGAIADCVIRSGAKSLELIQAMQVVALWYRPPEKAEATNFYQIVHMAAVMALDIGLGKRFNPSKARRGFGGPNAHLAPGPHNLVPQDSDTLEARRAWLCCYYMCASSSMVLRRPNLVRWTNYMKECIDVLESHPDALPSDKLFCQFIKIQRICEDVGLQFLMDDSTANISIKDPKVTYALNVLEEQLRDWKAHIPVECRTNGLLFFEHVAALYLHEIALHFNHNTDDFRLPFTEESLKSVNSTSDKLTHSQMAAMEACLRAAHGVLDTMMAFERATLRSLPMFVYFVRCSYAIVILIKMHVAVCAPNSEVGKVIKPEDLRVEFYLDGLLQLFSCMATSEDARPPPKSLRILNILKEWFQKHKQTVAAQLQQQQQQQQQLKDEPHVTSTKRERRSAQEQTPLQVLSQAATGNALTMSKPKRAVGSIVPQQQQKPQPQQQQQPRQQEQQPQQSWTMDDAAVYASATSGQQQAPTYPATDAYGLPIDQGMVDPMNSDYGWNTGFEQAMDLALGGMDGLQSDGLDNWFLGDSVAPFGAFQGEVPLSNPGLAPQWSG